MIIFNEYSPQNGYFYSVWVKRKRYSFETIEAVRCFLHKMEVGK